MESSSTSANSSFGSTASSSSPVNTSGQESERVAIKQEPSGGAVSVSDANDRGVWSHIFDESGAICLDVDDDNYPMDEEDIAADPRRLPGGDGNARAHGGGSESIEAQNNTLYHHHDSVVHDPTTPSSALLDSWGNYDMMSSSHQPYQDVSRSFVGTSTSMITGVAPTPSGLSIAPPHLPRLFPSAPLDLTTSTSTTALSSAGPTYPSGVKSEYVEEFESEGRIDFEVVNPKFCLSFEKLADGRMSRLSKPIVRDDGLLLVGTEHVPDSRLSSITTVSNRLFVTDFRSHSPRSINIAAAVCDLQWMSRSSVVAAIGSDIHLLLLDGSDEETKDVCTLTSPIRRVHADTVRELAVKNEGDHRSITIASGGFDETVVFTRLGESGDPATANINGKIDAYDVVSSLRWHPTEPSMLSWTTDGGDFQTTDIRARAKPQLAVSLNSILKNDRMGGLFTHEYISSWNVVLGYQSGQVLFLDLRKQRHELCCGSLSQAPLMGIGEVCRSTTGMCAMFGLGGFAIASAEPTGKLVDLKKWRPHNDRSIDYTQYKTSGSFSLESSSILAVSDSLGDVSVYQSGTFSAPTP